MQFLSARSSRNFTELIFKFCFTVRCSALSDKPGAPLFIFIIKKYHLKLYSAYKVEFLLIVIRLLKKKKLSPSDLPELLTALSTTNSSQPFLYE